MSNVVKCNATMTSSKDGTVMVHLSMCNLTTSDLTSTSNYDSAGALRFTVIVVMVYGIAVVGVFALGLINRKKRNRRNDDKEAINFIKHYDDVKRDMEQKSRVGAVSSLLHNIHRQSGNKVAIQESGLLKNLAFLALPLTKINEESESISGSHDDIEECLPSSVVIDEDPRPTCVFCDNLLETESVGPLCSNCMNRYRTTGEGADDDGDTEIQWDNAPEDIHIYTRQTSNTSDGFAYYPDNRLSEDDVFLYENEEETFDVENETNSLSSKYIV